MISGAIIGVADEGAESRGAVKSRIAGKRCGCFFFGSYLISFVVTCVDGQLTLAAMSLSMAIVKSSTHLLPAMTPPMISRFPVASAVV